MKTKKLFDSILAAILISLSLALTACDDDDDKDGGSSSTKLSNTAWYGEDNDDNYFSMYFYDDGEFVLSGMNGGCEGDYSVSGGKITFKNISGWGNCDLRKGTFEYKISGRKGDRDLVIYDALRGGNDLYLEEVEYSGSDDY